MGVHVLEQIESKMVAGHQHSDYEPNWKAQSSEGRNSRHCAQEVPNSIYHSTHNKESCQSQHSRSTNFADVVIVAE